jgi:Uri superfamily endonuclease
MCELAAGAAPPLAGTYLLWFDVQQPLSLHWRRDRATLLLPGAYVYLGSALGPGGLQARLRRHTVDPATRRTHWHIDHLTALLTPAAVRFMVGASSRECAWVQALAAAGAQFPARGFGSSDCRQRCPAHLAAMPAGWPISTLESLLA